MTMPNMISHVFLYDHASPLSLVCLMPVEIRKMKNLQTHVLKSRARSIFCATARQSLITPRIDQIYLEISQSVVSFASDYKLNKIEL